jgi:cytochrome c553
LSAAFTTVETFYTQRNKPEAITLAQTAKMGAQDAVAALKAGDVMKAQASIKSAQGTCAQCHKMLRDGDGKTAPYSFKADSGITAP